MTDEDKLKFEVGEGFKNLPEEIVLKIESEYETIQLDFEDNKISALKYIDRVVELLCNLRKQYNDEDFIQAVSVCGIENYGWALEQLKDKDVIKYAYKYLESLLDNNYISDEVKKCILGTNFYC